MAVRVVCKECGLEGVLEPRAHGMRGITLTQAEIDRLCKHPSKHRGVGCPHWQAALAEASRVRPPQEGR